MKRQAQMQPYRSNTAPDPVGAPTPVMVATFLIETRTFDGVTLSADYTLASGAPGYTLQVLFPDESLAPDPVRGEADGSLVFVEDVAQRIVATAAGRATYKIETGGRDVLIRVAALAGTSPVLVLTQGVYLGSVV
jgi:hypothetical protein